jgi:hypothetical protein
MGNSPSVRTVPIYSTCVGCGQGPEERTYIRIISDVHAPPAARSDGQVHALYVLISISM